VKNFELNYRQLLIALISEKNAVSKILKGQEKYGELLKEISKYDIDDHEPLPKQKDLLKTLGLKRKELIVLMREILICASNMHEDYWMISPERLGFLPNVGDRITIPFLRNNMTGGGYFKVKDVSHEIENQKHIIVIPIDDDILESD